VQGGEATAVEIEEFRRIADEAFRDWQPEYSPAFKERIESARSGSYADRFFFLSDSYHEKKAPCAIKLHGKNNRAVAALQVHRWRVHAAVEALQDEASGRESPAEIPGAGAQDDWIGCNSIETVG
jgi:hypothetical protein